MYYYVSQVDASITTAHNEMMGSGIRVVSYEGAMVLSRILRKLIDDQKRYEMDEGEAIAMLDHALNELSSITNHTINGEVCVRDHISAIRDDIRIAKDALKHG